MSRFLCLAIVVAGCFTPISRLEGGNVVTRVDGGVDAGARPPAIDAGVPFIRPPVGPAPVCVGGSPLTRYLRDRLAAVDAGCVGCLLHVRESTIEPVFVSTSTLQLEGALEDGATAQWAVLTAFGPGRALHAAPMDAGAPVVITPLEPGEAVTGRWFEGRFVFARSSGLRHVLEVWDPETGRRELAQLPSAPRFPLQFALGSRPLLGLETGVYVFIDDQLRVIDARTNVASLAPWDGIAQPTMVAYTTADGGVFVGDAFGSTLASSLSATSMDMLLGSLALLRTPTDLWTAAPGVSGFLYYRAGSAITRFELEAARLLVQERCGDGFATVSIDSATGAALWLSQSGGWPFDTRDFGEGPRLQPVTGGGGFLVRPDQL